MTAIWKYAGLPIISLPGGQVKGLPICFQCIADFGQDEILLHHADREMLKEAAQDFNIRQSSLKDLGGF
ncbi:amidase family protein [Paenibacillus dakarensis]|uniref:amidase family protein n=1 Tax=Paenibacillus dakarensis TaxID=1527293 RepID=UPI0006D59AC8|nr:amidase family protein [Paenibacillus dakarensis]